MSYSYDKRGSRPIYLDKRALMTFVDQRLVPDLVRTLKRLPQDQPIGSGYELAQGTFILEDVKNDRIHCGVTLMSRESRKKGTTVLMGRASQVRFEAGYYAADVTVEINGAFTPGEFLGGSSASFGGTTFQQDYLQPVHSCRTLTCLPYGIYTLLLHEFTHVADRFNPRVDYYRPDKSVDDERYFNHPGEVRAFMQGVVDEAVNSAKKLKQHLKGDARRLIDMSLKMSETWKMTSPKMTAANRNKVLKALYTAFEQEGLLDTESN